MFDTSKPEILLGLIIGGFIPYLMPSIPATLTKWLVIRSIFKRTYKTSTSSLLGVATLEPLSFSGIMVLTDRLEISPLSGVLLFLALTTALHLLLVFRESGAGFPYQDLPKRCLHALAVGMLYLGYLLAFAFAVTWWRIAEAL